MLQSRSCTVFVVFVVAMTLWPCLSRGQCSPSPSIELLDAIQHPPPDDILILTRPYTGTLKTVYSRNYQDDEVPEQLTYNILFNYDARAWKKADLPEDWSSEQIRNFLATHNQEQGMAVACADKASGNLDFTSYTYWSPTIFQKDLPTVKELSAFTLYSQLTKALTQNKPFATFPAETNVRSEPDGMHKPRDWLCFTPAGKDSIRVVNVISDIVFPSSKHEPPFIYSMVIREGLFHTIDPSSAPNTR